MPSVLTTIIIHFFKSTKVNDRRYEGLCRKKNKNPSSQYTCCESIALIIMEKNQFFKNEILKLKLAIFENNKKNNNKDDGVFGNF